VSKRGEEEGKMPKLRHIAIHTKDVDGTADFYRRSFEMVEIGRGESREAEYVALSDGDLNVTILRFNIPEMADRLDGLGSSAMGLHHFGFWVEDAEEARRRLQEAGAEHREDLLSVMTPGSREEKFRGPDGVMIDISVQGWPGARPLNG
jgi:catechol 2,3-dioxygenase-like lactoylglutathione lyase family enzyme